jgi:hypothetical protein
MAESDRLLGMYLHLARASKLRQQPLVRTKLLVLAGVQAESMGLGEIAALCRHWVLAQNPLHLVRCWPTIGEALNAEPFQNHVKQLRRRYSSEKVEYMLHSLGIEMGHEREAYFSDSEYAAALLNTRVEAIDEILAEPPRPKRESPTAPVSPPRPETGGSAAVAKHASRLLIWGPFAAGVLLLAAWLAATALGQL